MTYNFIYEDIDHEIICYYSQGERNLEKIFLSITMNDVSYVYFYLFVNEDYQLDIKMESLIELLHNYKLDHMYDVFMDRFYRGKYQDVTKKILKYPWLTISLIINNRKMIKKILNMYNNCAYNYNTYDLGNGAPWTNPSQLDQPYMLYDYIITYYPEFKKIFDEIKVKERKMRPIIRKSFVRTCS